MNFTQEWYRAYQGKADPRQAPLIPTEDDKESELHDMIISWCRRQDPPVPYGHGSMAHKTKRTPGEVDFYLLMPGGKILLIECKTKEGVLSESQIIFCNAAAAVGHKVNIVRDYDSFLELTRPFYL